MVIPTGFWLWLGILLLAVCIGGVIALMARRAMFSDNSSKQSLGLMGDLRAMRDRGDLSTGEYDRIRKRMAARAAGRDPDAIAPKPPTPEPPGPNHPESSG